MPQQRYSFEFFPPKTDIGREKLKNVRAELNALGPDFFSVTYGAGGSTRDNTKNIVLEMKQEGLSAAPHLSFGGDDEASMLELINSYKDAGIDRIVSLRGDQPSGMGATRQVYAQELVEFIRKHTGDHFHLEVAAYPEIHPDAKSYQADIDFLKAKLDAGANSAITQYFYSIDAWHFFMESCQKAGITKPIYPGVMPITNFNNLARFSRNCCAELPRWMTQKFENYEEGSADAQKFGIELVTRLCEQLLAEGAPGIHFYTMNGVEPVKTIWQNLDL